MSKVQNEKVSKTFLNGKEKVKVAAVQASYVAINKEMAIEKACRLIKEAGANGAELVAFPETFIPCFPAYYNAGYECEAEDFQPWILGMTDNAVVVPSDDTELIGKACREAGVYCVMGIHELDERPGVHTFYNTNVIFGSDGRVLGRHRKLKPTINERVYWGEGDGSDLGVYETSVGRVGTLICWEHHTILVRAAQMLMGEEFHIANWPGTWTGVTKAGQGILTATTDPNGCDLQHAAREYAFQSGCFVISVNGFLRDEDFLPEYERFINNNHMKYDWAVGGSAIISPFGDYIVAPVFNEETILYADCYAKDMKLRKFFFDGLGHYSRPDVANLTVNTTFNQNLKQATGYSYLNQLSEMFEVKINKLEKLVAQVEDSLLKK